MTGDDDRLSELIRAIRTVEAEKYIDYMDVGVALAKVMAIIGEAELWPWFDRQSFRTPRSTADDVLRLALNNKL